MKKKFTLLLAFCMLFLLAKGQVLLDETFDYSVANLSAESTWTTAGTLTTGTGRNIITPALTYSNSGGTYFLSGVGKTINSDISSATDYKSYKSFTASPVTTGAVYLSFLYKAGVTQGQTNSEVFGLATSTSAGAKVWVGKGVTAGTFKFGTTRSSTTSTDIKWAATEYSDINAVIFIVIKYDFTTTTSYLFINPAIASSSEPGADITDNSGTARTSLNNLWFRSTGSSVAKFNISGVRVSTSWANAVAAAASNKVPAPVVGIASGITTSGFTANWTKSENAVAYDIKVYSGTNLVNTTNAVGQATESIPVTGLSSGTVYTYKVIGIGDGTNYSNSDPSAASADFATLGLISPVAGVATSVTDQSCTANWTTVTNATGYDVKVFMGTHLISTTNAPGQASTSVAITGLSMGTSYTYTVTAIGDGSTFLDSTPSSASPVFITTSLAVNFINTDFGDGTWGDPASATPASGSFPSSSINGFVFEKAVIRVVTKNGRRGEVHTNDIVVDKNSSLGNVIFPTVNSLAQMEIHAYTGTAERDFLLEEYNSSTTSWDLIGTYLYNTKSKTDGYDSIYVISITRAAPSKFRIRNNGGGSMYISQVITRTTDPIMIPSPTVGTASEITGDGFTANWTPSDFSSGYQVFVYQDVNLISKTSASGQATSSVVITGLLPNTAYTYKVLAKGDGFVYYSDSYLSAASASVTTLDIPTAISDVTFGKSGFRIYPNPASDKVTFEYDILQGADVQLVIYNINNQIVKTFINSEYQSTGSYSKSFDVSGLKSGIYFARFAAGKAIKSFKIVISR